MRVLNSTWTLSPASTSSTTLWQLQRTRHERRGPGKRRLEAITPPEMAPFWHPHGVCDKVVAVIVDAFR
jgi:hypothetical protein